MARRERDLVAGGIYHVYARGVRKEDLFLSDEDRSQYLLLWRATVRTQGWRSLAYCLMDNHVHHLVETPAPDLHVGMQVAHNAYARHFNAIHGHCGHVFEGPFGSTRATSVGTLWYFAAYVALNPVRAGMCGPPDEYRWSSHPATLGRSEAPDWLAVERLLSFFKPGGLDSYRQIVDAVALLGAAGFEPPLSRLD